MSDQMATLIYVGPAGQDSPVVGPLEPGERYQFEVSFAAYLARQHPTHWQRPATSTTAPAEAKE